MTGRFRTMIAQNLEFCQVHFHRLEVPETAVSHVINTSSFSEHYTSATDSFYFRTTLPLYREPYPRKLLQLQPKTLFPYNCF
jgi:hypothetical protein